MKNLKNSSDALQTDQKATEKDQALASKNSSFFEKTINKAKKDVVGKITFYDSGEIMIYETKEDYIKAIKAELYCNPFGFKPQTLIKDTEFHKKVENLIRAEFEQNINNKLITKSNKLEKYQII